AEVRAARAAEVADRPRAGLEDRLRVEREAADARAWRLEIERADRDGVGGAQRALDLEGMRPVCRQRSRLGDGVWRRVRRDTAAVVRGDEGVAESRRRRALSIHVRTRRRTGRGP